jgi:hypothetical protein
MTRVLRTTCPRSRFSSPAAPARPEITAVCQWVNSYKRLAGGGQAPGVCWGRNKRSALVRVPMYKPNKGPPPGSS